MDESPLTPRLKKALAVARNLSKERLTNYVGIEHMLISVLLQCSESDENIKKLNSIGIDPLFIANQLLEKLDTNKLTKDQSLEIKLKMIENFSETARVFLNNIQNLK